MADLIFFSTPSEFRAWLEKHHEREKELLVGFYKKGSGKPSITWPESVDEALCFGWIDGVRKSLGEESYMIRFTPRKPSSNWSAVNVARVEELSREGRMRPAGLKAFEERSEAKTGIYAYEQKDAATLEKAEERQFKANKPAWEFFHSQPAWYRKTAIWRVVSAKKEETRKKRLATLIEESAQGRRT
ncbi:MAG TPA: YdeI/OmpD-associated family protein [Thermoanaerobaculia bacterium]|nr:YdeI/OmpD-associated family protein [Thermoanaerobaculia bacterium]